MLLQIKKKRVPIENELNKPSKKDKAITTKGLTNNLLNKYSILNGTKFFLREYFKILYCSYQLKNTLNILLLLLKFINIFKFSNFFKYIGNITK